MHILVCVKQVIEIEDDIKIASDGLWLDEAAMDLDHRINYYDEFALEEAVQIKESYPDVTVDAITVGPPGAETTLRRALALGADHAVHIRLESSGFVSADIPARLIADYIRQANPYDLILTGVMSEDAMQRLTGPMIAALCHLPCATGVLKETLSPENNTVEVVCELEQGLQEPVRLNLPALLTIQSGINRPRYASLSNRLRAKSQAMETIAPDKARLPTSALSVISVREPEKRSQGEFLQGKSEEKADKFLHLLYKNSLF